MEIRYEYDKSAGICGFMMALGRDALLHTLAATKQRSSAYSMAFSGVCVGSMTNQVTCTATHNNLSNRPFEKKVVQVMCRSWLSQARLLFDVYKPLLVPSLLCSHPSVSQLVSVQNLLSKICCSKMFPRDTVFALLALLKNKK